MARLPPVSLDLGQMVLASTHSGLQLQLSSLAVFDSPAEGVLDPTCLHLGETLLTGKVWVSRGDALRVVLGIRLDDSVGIQNQDSLLEVVSEMLKEARVSRTLRCERTTEFQGADT